MKKHKDLLAVLRSHKMRITPARRFLLQFILDNKSRQISVQEIQHFLDKNLEGIDRSSVYRNLDALQKLDIWIARFTTSIFAKLVEKQIEETKNFSRKLKTH